ncbi:MAG: GDP-L-fucose synthase [Bacteroidota bacterium]|nr:GDP-L-fucose synthase [Bacteroidota bacterium]
MKPDSKIFIAGHNGLVGSAITRYLIDNGYQNLITRNRAELDLLNQTDVDIFFRKEKIEYVFFAAAKVGGIMANTTYRGEFIFENLQIQNNIIHFSYKHGVKKLLFLGSSCIYPKNAPQPLKEEYLLSSELEYTNEPYAIAKIAGLKTIESYNLQYGTNFIAAMPTNLFGLNDSFDLDNSHVLPALIRKILLGKFLDERDFHSIRKDFKKNPVADSDNYLSEEKIRKILSHYGIKENSSGVEITLWGSGEPMREFLFSDDLAEACLFLMNKIDFKDLVAFSNQTSSVKNKEIRNTHINIGTGKDIKIRELAKIISEIIGFSGKLLWDSSKPDGTLRKYLDVSKLASLGWKHKTSLIDGIEKVYNNYIAHL